MSLLSELTAIVAPNKIKELYQSRDFDMNADCPELNKSCQECVEYLKAIYRPLLFFPDELEVTYKIGEFLHFHITGNPRDDGILIGRKGIMINSVRILIYSLSNARLNRVPCVLEVKDHMDSKYNPVNPSSVYRRRTR